MPELFVAMMKEEWRVHSTMFGSVSFALFPVMIFGIAFMGSFLLPLIRSALPPGNIALLVHSNFLLLGLMVGAFGLLGAEVMNRRFGQASLLSYSARSLPLTERFIFANFVVKDTVYYFFLWVLPFALGFLLASPFTGVPVTLPLLLLLTLSLSFLSGLSLVFFLSTVYERSKSVLAAVLAVFAIAWAAFALVSGVNPAFLFPPLVLFREFSWQVLLLNCAGIALLFWVSVALFSPDATGSARTYRDVLTPLTRRLSFFPFPPLAAKDLVDLYRSGGAVGQTLFSFLIPLVLIWFFMSLLGGYLPPQGTMFTFAVLTGIIAATMYTWLTTFDTFGAYSCLPIGVGDLITSKVSTFTLLQVIPAVFIASVAALAGKADYLVPSVAICLPVSFYALGVTIWLTGLSPAVLVYDARVLLTYLVLVGVVVTALSALVFTDPRYAFVSLLLLFPAWFFVSRGKSRWEKREQGFF
ncbi:MAG: hypothetical protein LUQ25_01465 [Methanoregulaceae archaeon]|nr:hypothetical protein [Methanoregulaceae archaeon]